MGVTNQVVSGMVLNSQPQRVPVPYTKTSLTPVEFLSTTGHANPVGIREVHLPRLNTLDDR